MRHAFKKGEAQDHTSQIMSFHSKSFHYNVDELPQELNSCSYQLACGQIGFIVHHFA